MMGRMRKGIALVSFSGAYILQSASGFCSKANRAVINNWSEAVSHPVSASDYSNSPYLSPYSSNFRAFPDSYNVELVDDDTWKVSSGLALAWQRNERTESAKISSVAEGVTNDPVDGCSSIVVGETDFDEIDNLRIRGNLFYKLDRNSKEYQEYSLDFHRKKSSEDNHSQKKINEENRKQTGTDKRKEMPNCNLTWKADKLSRVKSVISTDLVEFANSCSVESKKKRTATFNQLTGPYHEPFCLDIYISKASVRACIVHRVTSKVVAVAHSISKDMKFDLGSTRNSTACAAVGEVLAQRALADDIHDVIYTPRKGDKLEGKLQIVLQSVIDSGIRVKVKIKQKRHMRIAQNRTSTFLS